MQKRYVSLLLSLKNVRMSQFFLYLCTKTSTKMKRLWLLILLCAPLVVFAQQQTISGTVVDDKTGEPLDFTLKLDGEAKTVMVSHLGYKTQRLNLKEPVSVIRMKPVAIQLREIIVRNEDPRELVDIAIQKIPENYSRVPELLKAFYRETAMKRKHYIYVAEGVEDMYKTGSPAAEPEARRHLGHQGAGRTCAGRGDGSREEPRLPAEQGGPRQL